jgi:hypothetical protein
VVGQGIVGDGEIVTGERRREGKGRGGVGEIGGNYF